MNVKWNKAVNCYVYEYNEYNHKLFGNSEANGIQPIYIYKNNNAIDIN